MSNSFENINKKEGDNSMEAFENRIQKASPSTLDQIWNVMKNQATWAGMLGIALGSYACAQAFGNEPMVVQNIIDSMKENAPNPDPEKIRQVLLWIKIFAVGVLSEGAMMLTVGFLQRKGGEHPMYKLPK